MALARCEIQAIDQHWSLHRLAISLDGEPDDSLAREFSFARADPELGAAAAWPAPEPARWQTFLSAALEADVAAELAAVRARQESYLRRELDRIDEYFANYEQELTTRANRSASQSAKVKATDRLGRRQGRACPPPRGPGGAARDPNSAPSRRTHAGCRAGLARKLGGGAGACRADRGAAVCSTGAEVVRKGGIKGGS